MPITGKNADKLEAFAQEMALGKSAVKAAKAVGYTGSSVKSNAKKRAQRSSVRARVELRAEAAKDTKVTLQKLVDNSEEARLLAMDLAQPGAANGCIQTMAKLTGFWTDKVDVVGSLETVEVTTDMRMRALEALLAKAMK